MMQRLIETKTNKLILTLTKWNKKKNKINQNKEHTRWVLKVGYEEVIQGDQALLQLPKA